MSVAVLMPQLGLTMEEGTVSQWIKKTGEAVKKDEPLFSVSTDKVEMEVESSEDGTMGEILVPAGETVSVGTVLAFIVRVGGTTPGRAEASGVEGSGAVAVDGEEDARQPQFLSTHGEPDSEDLHRSRPLASPRAKRLARELNVDLAQLRGSGLDGQITEDDVRKSIDRQDNSTPTDHVRRLITERLTHSIQTIPTFSVNAEANAEHLLDLYSTLKSARSTKGKTNLTITDLLLAIFAQALKSSHEINALWQNNAVHAIESVDIGLAVATEKGVIAPVIRSAETLSLPALAATRYELVDKARKARLTLSDLEGGVGTLSNLGMYRVDHFQAIISPGQSSILAVGQIRKRAWVEEAITVKPTMILNLTVDHRVADGAAAAVFLGRILELIEKPQNLQVRPLAVSGDGSGRRSNA